MVVRGARKIERTIFTDERLEDHPDVKTFVANTRKNYAIIALRTYPGLEDGRRCVTVWALVKDKVIHNGFSTR